MINEPKLRRAIELIQEVGVLLKTAPPWGYVLEADLKAGERRTRADRNDDAADDVALRIGDCVQNLRAALDHAWARKVMAHVPEQKQRAVQFPFCEAEAELDKSIARRMPSYENSDLTLAIAGLRPFRGGNNALWAVHELGIPDRHTRLLLLGDFRHISSYALQRLVPDFPRGLTNCTFGQGRYDVVWPGPKLNRQQRRARGNLPLVDVKRLDVPVEVVFGDGPMGGQAIVPALNMMAGVTASALQAINEA